VPHPCQPQNRPGAGRGYPEPAEVAGLRLHKRGGDDLDVPIAHPLRVGAGGGLEPGVPDVDLRAGGADQPGECGGGE
jgi:hypothetical protein